MTQQDYPLWNRTTWIGPALLVVIATVFGTVFGIVLSAAADRTVWFVAPLFLVGVTVLVAVFIRPLWACSLIFLAVAAGNQVLPGVPLGLQVVHAMCALALASVSLSLLAGASADRLLRLELRLPLVFAGISVAGAIISTAISVDRSKSLKVTATLLAGLLLAAAIIIVARTGRHVLLLTRVAAIGSMVVTLPSLAGGAQLVSVYGGSIVKNRPEGSFSDPNELGCYSAIAMMLCLGWFIAARRRLERAVALIAAAGAGAALSLSLSRGAWIGAGVGILVLVFLHPGTRKAVAWLGLAAVSLGGISMLAIPGGGPVQVVFTRVMSISQPQENPYDVRPITWQEALREFVANPVLGNGPGTFSVLNSQSPSPLQFYPREHAHNGLLTIAAENGGLGLIAFVGLAVGIAIAVRSRAKALRATRRWNELGLLAGSAAALAALCGHLLVDYPLRNPMLMVIVWAVIGLALAASAIPTSPAAGAEIYASRPQ